MLNFSVKTNFDEDFFKDFSMQQLKAVLMKSMFKMEELTIHYAPVNTSELVQDITLFPQVLSDVYVLTSKAKYSAAMEYGTRPFYAPIKPLKAWAAKKLGDENIAYAVRAKIAKEGITAHPFMRPALFQVKGYWLNYFAAVQARKFK